MASISSYDILVALAFPKTPRTMKTHAIARIFFVFLPYPMESHLALVLQAGAGDNKTAVAGIDVATESKATPIDYNRRLCLAASPTGCPKRDQ